MLDLNTAGAQRPDGVIPDGTYARVVTTLNGGGYHDPNLPPEDQGLLRPSKSSTAVMLDVEFVVLTGPHKGRKFWQLFTVMGSKTNEKGESIAGSISVRTLRGMVESARGIRADDESPEANAKRILPGFHAFHGMEFAAKIGIEEGTDGYPDKNKLDIAVTASDADYAAIMAGQPVQAKPSRSRKSSGTTAAPARPTAPVPAWQQNAQPAASPAQAWATPPAAPLQPNGAYTPATQEVIPPTPAQPGPKWMTG